MKTRFTLLLNCLLILILVPNKNFAAYSSEEKSNIYFKLERNHQGENRNNDEWTRILDIDNGFKQVVDTEKGGVVFQLENSNFFDPYVTHPVGSWPEAVAIGDVNGDGRNDVVMTTSFYFDTANDYKLFVFLQNTTGELDVLVKYDAGDGNSVDIGDLNNDGKNDVVVTASDGVGVFLQNDTGNLAPMILFNTTNDPYKVRIGDLNNDGLMDVVSVGWGSQTNGYDVNVFSQNFSGTLNPPDIYTIQHDGQVDLEVEDINDDGLADILVMGTQPNTSHVFGVLYQNGIGSFDPAVYYNLEDSALAWGLGGIAAGDINSDTLNDVVVTFGGNQPNSFIAVYIQNTGGTLNSPMSDESYDCPEPVVIDNVSGDLRQDVIVAHGGWNALGVYVQDQEGSLMEEELYYIPYASHYNTQGLAIGDINSDGKNDVVIADYNNGLVVLYGTQSQKYMLTIASAEGGTTDPLPNTYAYYLGTQVYITAIAEDEYRFSHWSGDASGSDNPLTITMDSEKSIMANFEVIPPSISLSKTMLNFGSNTTGIKTIDQQFQISNSGGSTLVWDISDDSLWLNCYPQTGIGNSLINVSVNPDGLAPGIHNGIIIVSSASADNSPQFINVVLKIWGAGEDSPPFGFFDTPAEGLTVSGSVPVTGWALDDIEVTKVEIKRDPDPDDPPAAIGPDGLILISWPPEDKNNVVFVKGARPDVESLYPTYPLNDRAGWGYMLLTYGLPRQGNGTFRLYAFAEDATGHRVLLGTKQITSDNANRVKPFGTIDTPNPGEVISGNYINFGWVLTPPPKLIPTDGSTIWISMDGVYFAQPDYNHFRQDIYDSFPGYLNCDGAVGFFWIDTTSYLNGVHNIGWYAVDNEGQADGFGSRFFEIQNVGGTPAPSSGSDAFEYRMDTSGRLRISVEGQHWVEAEQLERIKIVLKGEGGNRFIGWGADENRTLPIGSTLDSEAGIFYWSIGPGFLNTHILHFAVTDGIFKSEPVQVVVNIVPKRFDRFTKKVKIKERKKQEESS